VTGRWVVVSTERPRADDFDRAPVVIQPDDSCPFCGSPAVGTLAKEITPDTYWRCNACGVGWTTPPPGQPFVKGLR